MRLQLVIQRHALPVVRILWTVGSANLPNNAGSSATVSKFLEQVNDIIPLESDDWGLEDYAVEVGGFECLHFSELGQVLKDEDEVHIRALQTSDLRARKFSGRHQISSDGKHLIDGVAFGRPFLRTTARPSIKIPPRKRQRLILDEIDDEYLGNITGEQQVVVHRNETGGSEEDADDTGDESDFDLHEADGSDLQDELQDLQRDDPDLSYIEEREPFNEENGILTRSRGRDAGLGIDLPFFGPYYNPLLDQYSQDEPVATDLSTPNESRRSRKRAQNSITIRNGVVRHSVRTSDRRGSTGSNKSVRFDDEQPATPPTVKLSNESDEEDSDFQPTDADESDKENTQPTDTTFEGLDGSDSTSSSDFVPSINSEDDTSSSGASSRHSRSGSGPDEEPFKPEQDGQDEPSKPKSPIFGDNTGEGSSKIVKNVSEMRDDFVQNADAEPEPETVATMAGPGLGKKETQKRNRRRQVSNLLAKLKKTGLLPQNATKADLESITDIQETELKLAGDRCQSKKLTIQEKIAAFEARKQALLESVQSRGVDVTDASNDALNSSKISNAQNQESPEKQVSSSSQEEGEVALQPSKPNEQDNIGNLPTNDAATVVPDSFPEKSQATNQDHTSSNAQVDQSPPQGFQIGSEPSTGTRQRRSKLDLASSKRMLFGSLGLRTPKTKEDEIALRESLMKDIKPSQRPRSEMTLDAEPEGSMVDADTDWKRKINLKAIECCYEGITLSEPPFPFVQRWDPQQQNGYKPSKSKRNKKGKKRKQQNSSWVEESQDKSSPSKIARSESYEPADGESRFQTEDIDETTVLQDGQHVHNSSFDYSLAANQQLLRESQDRLGQTAANRDEEDLPQVPDDLTAFPELTPDACKDGAIIAFKRFLMSADTNWQPQISDYVTAAVRRRREDGTLTVSLSKRDHSPSKALFDENTGQRVYSKFEMPGYDDDEGNLNGSQLIIPFNELIEPHLIKPTESNSPLVENPDFESSRNQPLQSPSTNPIEEASKDVSKTVNAVTVDVGNDARSDILNLIREAGWKSSLSFDNSIHSKHTESDTPNGPNVENKELEIQETSSRQEKSSPSRLEPSSSQPDIAAPELRTPPVIDENSCFPSSPSAEVKYPELTASNDEINLFQDERQHRSLSVEQDMAQDGSSFAPSSISPPSLRRGKQDFPSDTSICDTREESQLTVGIDGTNESEDDELPEPFSQAFMQGDFPDLKVKDESSQSQDIRAIPKTKKKSKTASRASGMRTRRSVNAKLPSPIVHAQHEDGYYPSSNSQNAQSSQVIDLTLSSDQPEPLETFTDENDSSYLPDTPIGWVNKPKANRSIGVATRAITRRRSKS